MRGHRLRALTEPNPTGPYSARSRCPCLRTQATIPAGASGPERRPLLTELVPSCPFLPFLPFLPWPLAPWPSPWCQQRDSAWQRDSMYHDPLSSRLQAPHKPLRSEVRSVQISSTYLHEGMQCLYSFCTLPSLRSSDIKLSKNPRPHATKA